VTLRPGDRPLGNSSIALTKFTHLAASGELAEIVAEAGVVNGNDAEELRADHEHENDAVKRDVHGLSKKWSGVSG